MRLATVAHDGSTVAVVVEAGRVAHVDGYADVGALLAAGPAGLDAARRAGLDGSWTPLDEQRLRQPVLAPGAVFCVGLNFAPHIAEMRREAVPHPTIFSKLARSLTGPRDVVTLPAASGAVDYEGELAVVIGKAGRDVAEEHAHELIGGYTLMNDVSMRDWQRRTSQFFAGKNFERSTPVGPVVVTADAFDVAEGELVTTVNGEVRQRARTAELMFGPAALVADISRFTTLEPGDLIATGTPAGVGAGFDPPRFLSDGDVVEVEIEGIGSLVTRFAAS
jgi:acylpyruvate hydrolase